MVSHPSHTCMPGHIFYLSPCVSQYLQQDLRQCLRRSSSVEMWHCKTAAAHSICRKDHAWLQQPLVCSHVHLWCRLSSAMTVRGKQNKIHICSSSILIRNSASYQRSFAHLCQCNFLHTIQYVGDINGAWTPYDLAEKPAKKYLDIFL